MGEVIWSAKRTKVSKPVPHDVSDVESVVEKCDQTNGKVGGGFWETPCTLR